ncbi:MAG: methyltransferase domain-containing protein [Desulfobacterales bacterium]|nr:methyltransferase domain-containing protein [Desulfobacterales bacterium]MCP4163873.1 methyltransferase domain-containing protein [Deltaproteobacteria bacterium]
MNKIKAKFESLAALFGFFMIYKKIRVGKIFDHWYKGQKKSQALQDIYAEVYGTDYNEEIEPGGYIGMGELKYIADHLCIENGQSLIDLGCGRGGPGMWIARETKCSLTGVDISAVGIDHCKKRAIDFDLNGQTNFYVGDICRTEKSDSSYDGAISIDTLVLVSDKLAAIKEVKRILKPNARFILTSWEADLPFAIKDYKVMMQNAGFEVEEYYEISNWKQRQLDVYAGILASKKRIIKEMGKKDSNMFIREAKNTSLVIDHMRHILLVARNI